MILKFAVYTFYITYIFHQYTTSIAWVYKSHIDKILTYSCLGISWTSYDCTYDIFESNKIIEGEL